MTHEITNQHGKHMDGEIRDEVIWAIEHDKTSFDFYGSTVEIEKHDVDAEGNKITLVKVQV